MGKSLWIAVLGAVVGVLFAGCATQPPAQLEGTVWRPVKLYNQGTAQLTSDADVRIVFGSDGRTHGFCGNNNFFGPFTLTPPDGLQLGNLGVTRRGGPNLAYEQNFLTMLRMIRFYSIEADQLSFMDEARAPLAVFAGTPPEDNSEVEK